MRGIDSDFGAVVGGLWDVAKFWGGVGSSGGHGSGGGSG